MTSEIFELNETIPTKTRQEEQLLFNFRSSFILLLHDCFHKFIEKFLIFFTSNSFMSHTDIEWIG